LRHLIFIFLIVCLCFSGCVSVDIDDPDLCSDDSDCNGGQSCSDEGICLSLCSDNSDCEDGYCNGISRLCGECLVDSHCEDGFICNEAESTCIPFCGNDAECEGKLICVRGECRSVYCETVDDCEGKKTCLDGRCVKNAEDSYPEQTPCTPGENSCWKGDAITCEGSGLRWRWNHTCPEEMFCSAGVCKSETVLELACQPYELRCESKRRVQICRPDGSQWLDWMICSQKHVCDISGCIPEESEEVSASDQQ